MNEQQNQVQQNISKRKTRMAIPNWINNTYNKSTAQKNHNQKMLPTKMTS